MAFEKIKVANPIVEMDGKIIIFLILTPLLILMILSL
jgi:hypothetical protein